MKLLLTDTSYDWIMIPALSYTRTTDETFITFSFFSLNLSLMFKTKRTKKSWFIWSNDYAYITRYNYSTPTIGILFSRLKEEHSAIELKIFNFAWGVI